MLVLVSTSTVLVAIDKTAHNPLNLKSYNFLHLKDNQCKNEIEVCDKLVNSCKKFRRNLQAVNKSLVKVQKKPF
jgi:hypothetical protein